MEEKKKMSEDLLNDLLMEHGDEYLYSAGRCDDVLIDMEEFNDNFADYSPLEIANYVLNADRFNPDILGGAIESGAFNINDDYYYIDGYGYPVSVPYENIVDYYNYQIEKNDFIEWLDDNDYIDDID